MNQKPPLILRFESSSRQVFMAVWMAEEFPGSHSKAWWNGNCHQKNRETDGKIQQTMQVTCCSVLEIEGSGCSTEQSGDEGFGEPRTEIGQPINIFRPRVCQNKPVSLYRDIRTKRS